MADGEINVNVKSEGTQDTLDNIAQQSAEGGDGAGLGGAGGGGKKGGGGGIAGLLQGIGGKLIAILGVLGFLASLKPIQELLSGIQRLFSVAILPLVALLTALLRPVLQKLLRFIGNLDFDNLAKDLVTKLAPILESLPEIISQGLRSAGKETIEGVNSQAFSDALFQFNRRKEAVEEGEARRGPYGTAVMKGSWQEDLFIQTGLIKEQSSSSADNNITEKTNEGTLASGTGGPGG